MNDDRTAHSEVSHPWQIWLRRIGWASVSAVALLLLQSLFHQPVGLLTMAIPVALLAAAAIRPFEALLLLASFGPISTILFVLTRTGEPSVQFAETLTLAFIAGWAGRRTLVATPLAVSPGMRWASMLLLALAVASGLANWAGVRMEHLDEPVGALIQTFITRDYLLHLAGSSPITAAALLCEGMLLLIIAADICAGSEDRRDAVLRAMVIGAAAAGAFNVLRIVEASVAQENAWTALLNYVRTLRVNVQYADVNAAGSYFALMLPIALGLFARRRGLAAVCIPLIAVALWISGSRFALGGAFVGMAISALLALRGRSWRRAFAPALAGLILIGGLAGVLWKSYPANRNAAFNVALNIRIELAKIGLDMAAHHPAFGVGLGSVLHPVRAVLAVQADFGGRREGKRAQLLHPNPRRTRYIRAPDLPCGVGGTYERALEKCDEIAPGVNRPFCRRRRVPAELSGRASTHGPGGLVSLLDGAGARGCATWRGFSRTAGRAERTACRRRRCPPIVCGHAAVSDGRQRSNGRHVERQYRAVAALADCR